MRSASCQQIFTLETFLKVSEDLKLQSYLMELVWFRVVTVHRQHTPDCAQAAHTSRDAFEGMLVSIIQKHHIVKVNVCDPSNPDRMHLNASQDGISVYQNTRGAEKKEDFCAHRAAIVSV